MGLTAVPSSGRPVRCEAPACLATRGWLSGSSRSRMFRSWASARLIRYRCIWVTAATSKAASAASVTAMTPARTRVRSRARRGGRASRARRLVLTGCLRVAGPGAAQDVTDAALGVDHLRPVAGQLAPQVRDVGGDHCAGAAEVVVPDVVQELGPGQHPARVEHQVAQQAELGRGQLDQAAAAADL